MGQKSHTWIRLIMICYTVPLWLSWLSDQSPVVQRVISLTVLADSIYNILIFFAAHFFSKKFQNICVSLEVNFNESLTNNIVSFEQLDPDCL